MHSKVCGAGDCCVLKNSSAVWIGSDNHKVQKGPSFSSCSFYSRLGYVNVLFFFFFKYNSCSVSRINGYLLSEEIKRDVKKKVKNFPKFVNMQNKCLIGLLPCYTENDLASL